MAYTIDEVIDHLSAIPPFPRVTTHLLRLLNDQSASVSDLATVISADPSLVVKVLHLANSPFYMLSRPVQSVSEAVFVLGVNAIKSITTALSIQQGISRLETRPDAFNISDFWKHSYATAIAANRLARNLHLQDPEKLYLIGLLHDIGKIIQATYWPETWKAAMSRLSHFPTRYEEIEPEMFNQGHRELAAILSRNWQLPEDISLILDPGTDAEWNEKIRSEREIIDRADMLATMAGFAFPKAEELVSFTDDLSDLSELTEQLKKDVEYQLRILES